MYWYYVDRNREANEACECIPLHYRRGGSVAQSIIILFYYIHRTISYYIDIMFMHRAQIHSHILFASHHTVPHRMRSRSKKKILRRFIFSVSLSNETVQSETSVYVHMCCAWWCNIFILSHTLSASSIAFGEEIPCRGFYFCLFWH